VSKINVYASLGLLNELNSLRKRLLPLAESTIDVKIFEFFLKSFQLVENTIVNNVRCESAKWVELVDEQLSILREIIAKLEDELIIVENNL